MADSPEIPARERRVNEILAMYLQDREAGLRIDEGAFLAEHAEYAPELREFLENEALFDRAAGTVSAGETPKQSDTLCPHCRLQVDATTPCSGCGARFSLNSDAVLVTHFGRFEVRGVAGQGGYGTVYKAWDPQFDRLVAIKVPRGWLFAGVEQRERFLREARLLTDLYHPNIVRLREVATQGGMPLLVSEYIDGPNLDEVLRREMLPAPRTVRLLAAVAEGLEYAHGKNVVHRDLKPDNILLGPDDTPLLTDFGLAVQAGVDTTLTLSGDKLGTAAYMSPEQVRGGRVGVSADIWALGVILYRMLTGARPFEGTLQKILHQILHADPRSPRKLNEDCPRDLETICLKCLEKDPARRYASVAEFAADLERHSDGKPILARPTSRAEKTWRWVRRNPWLAGVSTLSAMLLSATIAGTVLWALHTGRQREEIGNALRESQRLRAENLLSSGLAHCETGDVEAGLLQLAACLEMVPATSQDLNWTARANIDAWLRATPELQACRPVPTGDILGMDSTATGLWVHDAGAGTIDIWDLKSEKWKSSPWPMAPRPKYAALTGEGTRLVTAWSTPTNLSTSHVFEVKSQSTFDDARTLTVKDLRAIALSHDGRRLLTAQSLTTMKPETRFQWWDAATLSELKEARFQRFQQPGRVTGLAVSRDGSFLAAVLADTNTLRVTQLPTGPTREVPLTHDVSESVLALSPDGRWLLIGGKDHFAQLVDLPAGKVTALLRHRAPVTAVVFHEGSNAFTTAASGDALRTWAGLNTLGQPRATVPSSGTESSAGHANGQFALPAFDGHLRLWQLDQSTGIPELVHKYPRDQSNQRHVAVSPDGSLIATSTFLVNGTSLWDAHGKLLRRLAHPFRVRQMVFSPNSRMIATVGYDNAVMLWNIDGTELATLRHDGVARRAAFSPDDQILVTTADDGCIRRWDITAKLIIGEPIRHGVGAIRDLAVSPRQSVFATLGEDGFARLWNYETVQPAGPENVIRHGLDPQILAFSPDGSHLLTAGGDHTARLWNVDTGRLVGLPMRHTDQITTAAFAPDGLWILTGSEDGTLRYWDLAARPLGPYLRQPQAVKTALPGTLWSISAGREPVLRVWPAPQAAEIGGLRERLAAWAGTSAAAAGEPEALPPDRWRREP